MNTVTWQKEVQVLWKEEEALRHALLTNPSVVYVERAAQRWDANTFREKPYERYAVGLLVGLFVHRILATATK